jgi:CHAT domain-containing protein
MNRFRVAACAAVLFSSLAALAQNDPLPGIGKLLIAGRAAEARMQLVQVRDEAVAQKNPSREAAAWLLLGLTDVSMSDAENARVNLLQAEGKYTALGDYFGAWMSLWLLGEVENGEGHYDDAIVVHERAQKVLERAADPASPFSIDTLKVLGPVFGMATDALGPVAQYPELVKPILLQFAGAVANDAYAHLLIEAGRDLDKAEALLTKAAASSTLFGGFHDFEISVHMGELRQIQWRLEEAREQYVKAIDGSKRVQSMVGGGPVLELGILDKLAKLELLSGRLDEGLAWNDRALSLARAAGNPKSEAAVLEARGDLLQMAGREEAALGLFEESMKIATANNDLRRQASLHSTIGTLMMFKGTYGGAVQHLEKAIGLYQTLEEPLLESTTWLILAEVHNLLDVKDSHAIENARALAKKSGYKLAEETVELMAAFHSLTRGTGKREDAEAVLQTWSELPDTKTLMQSDGIHNLLRETLRVTSGERSAQSPDAGPHVPQFARWVPLMLQGQVQVQRGDFAAGRRSLTEALALNPGRDLRASMLALIGTTYWREGNRDEGIRFFKEAAKTLEASALDVKVEELLTSYLGSNRRVYFEILVDMLAQEGQTDEAFAQAERARARAFLQLVGNHRFNAERGADPRIVREAEILRTHIIDRERQMKEASPADAERIAADLQRERDRYKTVMTHVKASNPEYAALTTVEPLQISAVRDEIPADATVINYFVAPFGVHVWVVDRTNTHHSLLPLDRAGLQRIVCWAEQFGPREDARGVTLPSTCTGAATAEEAYDKLFAPIAETIKTRKLVLVPHNLLHYVPFAALHNRETGHDLVDDYILTYAPSVSALRFLRAKETPVDGSALVLGDPASPLPGLRKLPGAEREATTIAHTLGVTPRLGADARESLLYGLGGKTDLVHLAAHGLYDAANPLFSRIALAAGDSQDGSLTVDEILSSVDLTGVNLVVLSACRTAVGARSGGDEVVGLTRALLYAGTPGVLSTLWNIDDAASVGLMDEFYHRLQDGATAAEALREAQLAIKKTERFSDPKYWAAFTLHGDPQGRWKAPDEQQRKTAASRAGQRQTRAARVF